MKMFKALKNIINPYTQLNKNMAAVAKLHGNQATELNKATKEAELLFGKDETKRVLKKLKHEDTLQPYWTSAQFVINGLRIISNFEKETKS